MTPVVCTSPFLSMTQVENGTGRDNPENTPTIQRRMQPTRYRKSLFQRFCLRPAGSAWHQAHLGCTNQTQLGVLLVPAGSQQGQALAKPPGMLCCPNLPPSKGSDPGCWTQGIGPKPAFRLVFSSQGASWAKWPGGNPTRPLHQQTPPALLLY